MLVKLRYAYRFLNISENKKISARTKERKSLGDLRHCMKYYEMQGSAPQHGYDKLSVSNHHFVVKSEPLQPCSSR